MINEQINWKQRFFVPTDEQPGIAILAALLNQFPVITTHDDETDCDGQPDVALPQANALLPVDLEDWIIEPAEAHPSKGVAEQEPIGMTESGVDPTSDESELTCTHPSQSPSLPIARHAIGAVRLQTLQPDYRTAAIQIGSTSPKASPKTYLLSSDL